jgi:AcrR family transcriptional regulator
MTRKPSRAGAKRSRRTQAERSGATRAKIMAAARDCVFELGYGGATMSAIARRAGVTRGALQHHYGSRADVFKALIDHFFDALPVPEPAAAGDPVRAVRDFLARTFAVYGTRIAVAIMLIRIGAQGERAIAAAIERKFAALDPVRERVWTGVFRRAGLSAAEASRLREILYAVLRGFAVRQAYLKTGYSASAEFARVAEMVALYIERRTRRARKRRGGPTSERHGRGQDAVAGRPVRPRFGRRE